MSEIEVVAPNLKRRLSGVTATVVRLIPVQARMIGIVATGPGLPPDLPHVPLIRAATLPRDRWRVWHARRNTEMALGLILRHLFRRKYRLLFTSAAQRRHTGFTRWLIRQQDALIATSPQAASYLERPATVILHGVDLSVFHPANDRAALRAELGFAPDDIVIGCFGRIRAQKGVDLLIEAALRLFPSRPRAQLIFSGRITTDNQAFAQELQARIAKAGLSRRIRFLGELPWDQVVRNYQALDLFAAPARWEGFGLTPLEAAACGVPSVASRVGAYETLIRDGETGSLVAREDVDALTAALARWLDDDAARRAAGAAALAHVSAHHAIEGEAQAITAVYRRLLA
ncbi:MULTISPECIES: glycosyltransferase family 4 protein [unclassified Paracoccus (in: a-proteobacteria)]|uniref:glycosyltransferase family 4 protein n=1 Tax=unclassified Paracoccus (in: a-proteobacteria) TaxID=2688777 RepID=UPI0012B3CC30|nr:MULTISPECIES: glycosyltransferase family 4 protein [unclassified Paracoccus (in: a-proteobacteria)]UXU75781.1 glycosyltransferase family 4 protein [Paracoccus sp. SMMA_5]UXU81690.1 glycosyltransferase family 4 protein [Paracoccus sp. SMMA_5_TC]